MSSRPMVTFRDERREDLEAISEMLFDVDAAWGEVPFRVAVREGGLPLLVT